MIGEHLSHYKLLQRLGAGGMGVVYKAQDTKLERLVAIKLLNAAAVANPERVQRFVQEAKTTSALNHPSITTIHQLGEAGGQHFITMEFVEGDNLRERLRRGPLEMRQVLDVGIQIVDGLAAAHAVGIVHRDLKPENLMLRPDGLAKILDFGLAKLLRDPDPGLTRQLQSPASDETIVQTSFGSFGSEPTLPGMVMGTVGYMSPEQVRGEPADGRSDIFAVGCVLYELVTGQRPFGSGTPIEVMHAILKEQPRAVHDLRPEVPVELERILRKAMAKDCEERYQNAKDLAIDLRALRREVESGTLTATYAPISGGRPALRGPARRTPRWGWIFGGGALAIALAVALLALLRGGKNEPAPSETMQITKVTASGTADSPALSPDGRFVAFVTNENGKAAISLRQLATATSVQLLPPGEASLGGLVFSPDGNWLQYWSNTPGAHLRVLYQIAALGGTPRRLYEDVDSAISFAPDGKRFVFMRHVPPYSSEIYTGSIAATDAPQLLVARSDSEYLTLPQWSPDGRSIAVSMRTTRDPGQVRLALVPATGGPPQPLPGASWSTISSLAWAHDGNGLYLTGQHSSQDPSAQLQYVRARDGAAHRISNDVNSYAGVGVSADGKTLATLRYVTSSNLWLVPAGGTPEANSSAARQITTGTGLCQRPSLSPDGQSIAYMSDAAGNPDIWVVGIDGTNNRQLTTGPALEVQPAWSPDGKHIAYTMVRDDSLSIWVMDADGGGARELVRGQCAIPCWSFDSAWIYFHKSRGVTPSVWRVKPTGGTPEQVVPPWSAFPATSPRDAALLCWTMPDTSLGVPKMTLLPATGGAKRLLDVPIDFKNYSFGWSADGTSVIVHTSKGGASNLLRYAVDGGEPRTLTQFSPGTTTFSWAPTSDGQSLVCSRGSSTQDVVLLQNFD